MSLNPIAQAFVNNLAAFVVAAVKEGNPAAFVAAQLINQATQLTQNPPPPPVAKPTGNKK